jgi:RNA-directed DNA polymerase
VGPTKTIRANNARSLYDSARSRGRLWESWSQVYAKAVRSKSADTSREARHFAENQRTNIERIAKRLHARSFQFAPQKGVLVQKKNKTSKRPVVVAPIESRIVQRAILDTLQSIPAIHAQLTEGYNFGGVPGEGWGVPGAVLKVLQAVQSKPYFIRTDIKSFFMRIPRDAAVERILTNVSDATLNDLLRNAVATEIADAQSYGADLQLFPIADEGVAQGSSLSPLLCNLLLTDFDRSMNGRGVVTVRYIDDFLILAKDQRSGAAAFQSARRILGDLGLDCYDPARLEDQDKAEHGDVAAGMTFLGCEITADRLRPSRDNWRGLLTSLRKMFNESARLIKDAEMALRKHETYAETVVRAGKTVQGWANTFSFCTDERLVASIDLGITTEFAKYHEQVARTVRGMTPIDRRRAMGIFAVANRIDSPERQKAHAIISAR